MGFGEDFLSKMDAPARKAVVAMAALEAGAEANPDEHRMVGHYWLRSPELAPSKDLAETIAHTNADIHAFADEIHASGEFTDVLVIGIGVVGYILRWLQVPVLPLVLGVVLGYMVESNFRRSLLISGGDPMIFLSDTASLILLVIASLLTAYSLYKEFSGPRETHAKL
jgi:hypothetical protein